MATFLLVPARNAAEIVEDPKSMLEAGTLAAYTVRSNGTTRHLDLAPLGSTRRDTAEWINEQMEDGASVAQVARDLHVSNATVRRYLLSLQLTEEIEAGEWDEIWLADLLAGDAAVALVTAGDDLLVTLAPETGATCEHGNAGDCAGCASEPAEVLAFSIDG